MYGDRTPGTASSRHGEGSSDRILMTITKMQQLLTHKIALYYDGYEDEEGVDGSVAWKEATIN
jgi:hypothetical protein